MKRFIKLIKAKDILDKSRNTAGFVRFVNYCEKTPVYLTLLNSYFPTLSLPITYKASILLSVKPAVSKTIQHLTKTPRSPFILSTATPSIVN